MKIIDAHVHPETTLQALSKTLKEQNIEKALVYVLKDDVPCNVIPENMIVSKAVTTISGTRFLNMFSKYKIKGIKFLPYEQEITRDKFMKYWSIAQTAQEKGYFLTICSTYGSKLLYETNGVELAYHIRKDIDIPIILAHAGGARIFDAMNLAKEYDNVFLDLSFSLQYWWGSTVIQDIAFAINKLDGYQVFYGSDYPCVSFKDSMWFFNYFADRYGISKPDKERILYDNFKEFEEKYIAKG